MIIFDNVISKNICDEYILQIERQYKERCDNGMDPSSFSTRLMDLDNQEPIIGFVKDYIETRVKITLNHRWSQLQVWPVDSFSARHIHDDPRAGDANHTSMLYLNDNFVDGVFFTDDITVKPKVGRLTLFNGRETYHGVTMVKNKPRYSIIFWWNV